VVRAVSPAGASARALVQPGKAYAVYVHHGRPLNPPIQVEGRRQRYAVDGGAQRARLALELPAGNYSARWLNTKTGAVEKNEAFRHAGGPREIVSPEYTEDIALSVTAAAP
jgi:hypothetical protein